MTRKEKAIELHDKGFNCAQAVACAFAEETGIPEETLFAACEGFGLGMGGMAATCGAVSGAVMLAGLKNGILNYRKYDSCLENALTVESPESLCKIALNRLRWPSRLEDIFREKRIAHLWRIKGH